MAIDKYTISPRDLRQLRHDREMAGEILLDDFQGNLLDSAAGEVTADAVETYLYRWTAIEVGVGASLQRNLGWIEANFPDVSPAQRQMLETVAAAVDGQILKDARLLRQSEAFAARQGFDNLEDMIAYIQSLGGEPITV